MINGQLILEPEFSIDLLNPAVKKLRSIIDADDFDVLYVYGPSGTGKSLAISLLFNEAGFDIYYLDKVPDNPNDVDGISKTSSILSDNSRRVVVVDDITRFTKKEVKMLYHGDWGKTKLVLVGSELRRTDGHITGFSKRFRFKKVKFNKFSNELLERVLAKFLLKHKVPIQYNDKKRLAEFADGDIRKLLMMARLYTYVYPMSVDTVLETTGYKYNRRLDKFFSTNFDDVLEEIINYGWYYSAIIIFTNLLRMHKVYDIIEVLLRIIEDDTVNKEQYLAIIAMEMARRRRRGGWTFPSNKKITMEYNRQILASPLKQYLYYGGVNGS